MGKRKLYIASQLVGWSSYILIAFFLNQLAGVPVNGQLLGSLISAFVLGLSISHFYRSIILKNDWLRLGIAKMIPRFVIGSLLMASLFEFFYFIITSIIAGKFQFSISIIAQEMASWIILFLLWSLVYFFYHFFKNYKNEEIKNLRWEATKNEIELNKLKSQLNPHFMFNSMNSIRALIDENPKKAKLAVTQLSNLLRSNLLMGRQKLIPLQEEIKLVQDYLDLESIRYEERLSYSIDLASGSNGIQVPPLMIQTLVENGIKHGISTLPKGGHIEVKTQLNGEFMLIQVVNAGQYLHNGSSETGFGLINTQERLKILFGRSAHMEIKNLNSKEVITEIKIPKTAIHEN